MTDQEIKDLIASIVPIGAIQAFAMPEAPDGWLPCNGKEFSVERYPLLYNVIGNTFGGEQGKTFVLPDLQGRFVRGYDEDGNRDPERNFGTPQEDAIQEHGHQLRVDGNVSGGEHNHNVYYYKWTLYYGTNIFANEETMICSPESPSDFHNAALRYVENKWSGFADRYRGVSTSSDAHTHKLPNMQVDKCDTRGGGVVRTDTETRPKNVALLYCIKYK